MITFKQKLTAIKESIDIWDTRSRGIGTNKGCPLCVIYLHDLCCEGCPIYEKTGKTLCTGTPHCNWKQNRTFKNAEKFRDWLKDLYIEVSEAGESAPVMGYDAGSGKKAEVDYVPWQKPVGLEIMQLEGKVKKLEDDLRVVHKHVRNSDIAQRRKAEKLEDFAVKVDIKLEEEGEKLEKRIEKLEKFADCFKHGLAVDATLMGE